MDKKWKTIFVAGTVVMAGAFATKFFHKCDDDSVICKTIHGNNMGWLTGIMIGLTAACYLTK